MFIKTTTSLWKNIKNIENFFEENSNVTVLTNKNKIVWALISEDFWNYLFKTWIIEKYENNLFWEENKTDSKKEEVFPWLEDSVWTSNNDIKEEKQELNSYWRPVYKSQPKIVDDDDPSSIFA